MLTIARAGTDDLADLLPLFLGYLRFYGREVEPLRAESFLLDRMQRDESIVLLARRDDVATGFVQLYPAFASLSLARSWILNDLYVDPADRGAGTARALLEAARELGRETGAVELMLQTAHDNAAARTLYERLGWVRDEHFVVYTLDPATGAPSEKVL
jgi:GNAT superfamily N-acetyltransferase